MKFADLHLHTIFSDGTYSPQELTHAAVKAGLACISVVDHDTVSGIRPVLEAALGLGLEVLPGIELSCECADSEIHILGYLIDCKNKELLGQLDMCKNNRIERIHKMVDKLKGLGLELEAQDVLDMAGTGTLSRLHLARAMERKGLVSSTFEAFQKYIGAKCPGYVLGFKFSPQEAIQLIKRAGGIPVLAHPHSLGNDELLAKVIESGIMGLEAYYPEYTRKTTESYLELAKKHNLLVTGGSDCHGLAKPEVKIGSTKIPYELVEKLKEAQSR